MNAPTAAEIIERVKARYASCRSYEDTGQQSTRFTHEGSGSAPRFRTTKKKFRTAFVRPDLFFFEFREVGLGPESEWEYGVVCATPSGTQRWWSLRSPHDKPGDLSNELGAFAGVSRGTSVVVPSSLIPTLRTASPLPDPETATLLDDMDLDGVRCHRIEGKNHPMRLAKIAWVEAETYDLRRTDERSDLTEQSMSKMHEDSRKRLQAEVKDPEKLASILARLDKAEKERNCEPFTTEITTIWHPRMDHDINPAVFEFTPPE